MNKESEQYKSAYQQGYCDAKKAVWDFSYKPIKPFDDGLTKEDRKIIDDMFLKAFANATQLPKGE